ncbi:hypothetical protein [Caldisericum sp.]|uniref:hypothetical protein n=1 Tax=Caldisericum sp. TaxID=2499687 RepID=UPI003D11FA14
MKETDGKENEKPAINHTSKDAHSSLRKPNLKLFLITMLLDLFEDWGQALVAAYIIFIVLMVKMQGFSLFKALIFVIPIPGIYIAVFIANIMLKQPVFDFFWEELFPIFLFAWSAILFVILNNKTFPRDLVKFLYLFSFIGIPVFFISKYFKERFAKILQFYKQTFSGEKAKIIEGFVASYVLMVWVFGLIYATTFSITNERTFCFDTINPPGLFDFFYFSFITSLSPAYNGHIVPSSIISKILCFVETIVFLIIVGLFFANITNIRSRKK